MGSRNKKRRRRDGSVADGRAKAAERFRFDPVAPVPADVLEEAMTIAHLHYPIGADMADADFEVLLGALSEMAQTRSVDEDHLGVRAEKLHALLSRPALREFWTVAEDGRVVIDPQVVAYAASVPTDNSMSPLEWPPGAALPAIEGADRGT